ncbi:hypothetical protein C0995_007797 [Termitomyces sp. Mi166|nr:hypothetical protein C0995_007797 [Termitomyces sp. Mi166\
MPKRGAEKDLNKDNADYEEEDEEPSTGFVRANDEEISRRRIAGLPRRAQSAARIASPNPPPTSQFVGFSSSSSPLFAPLPTNGSLIAPTPTVAPTATSTAKTFASFLEAPSSTTFPAAPQPPQLTLPSFSGAASEPDDPSLVKYYTSLRGLNASLLAALTKATEEDPFIDISDILDRYKSLRLGVQNEFEESSKKSTTPAPASEKPAYVPPVPPSGGFPIFGGFGKPSSSSSADLSNNKGGFQPKITSSSFTPLVLPSPGFSFSVTPAQTSASPGPLEKPTDSGSSSPFGPSATGSLNSLAAPEKSLSSPAAKPVEDKRTSSSAPFMLGVSSSSEKASSTAFTFGSSTSGNKALSSTFSFGATPSSSFTFGKTGSSASASFGLTTTTGLFGNTSTTSSESSAPPKVPSFGSFGKPTGSTGSIGNPVGFGFGVPVRTQESDVSTKNSSDKKEDSDEGTQSQADGAAAEGGLGLITRNPHDEEGKGEEDEDTIHDARLKVFRLNETDSGSSWADLGIGILRIKKHRETSTRRILLRNSSTGKIILNFKLYSGLKPTQNKKSLVFVGHDETGASQTYTVRLADEKAATTLREVLQKEIASIEAKSDD